MYMIKYSIICHEKMFNLIKVYLKLISLVIQ